jgi:putative transposase
MALPRRKPNRLPNYDYSQAGYYFITLCTKDKQPLFWQPSVGADIIRPPGLRRMEYD